MLKHEVATTSIWKEIKELRDQDVCSLAPEMQKRAIKVIDTAQKLNTTINGVYFDPIIFETGRTDRLQKIYFSQGTTKARTALYGWHFYGLATDFISAKREWTVPDSWWALLAKIMEDCGLDPGRRWANPDNPHGQYSGLNDKPSDRARSLYFNSLLWQGKEVLTGASHYEGLLRVWKAVGAI